jgi:hypothetical protein
MLYQNRMQHAIDNELCVLTTRLRNNHKCRASILGGNFFTEAHSSTDNPSTSKCDARVLFDFCNEMNEYEVDSARETSAPAQRLSGLIELGEHLIPSSNEYPIGEGYVNADALTKGCRGCKFLATCKQEIEGIVHKAVNVQ